MQAGECLLAISCIASPGTDAFYCHFGKFLTFVYCTVYSEYMIMEVEDKDKGIEIGGHTYNNLRYADDAVVISENESDLQELITTRDALFG